MIILTIVFHSNLTNRVPDIFNGFTCSFVVCVCLCKYYLFICVLQIRDVAGPDGGCGRLLHSSRLGPLPGTLSIHCIQYSAVAYSMHAHIHISLSLCFSKDAQSLFGSHSSSAQPVLITLRVHLLCWLTITV